jgi:HK97 family phage portal protein
MGNASTIELLPLTPQQVRTERGEDYAPRYFVTWKDGEAEREVPAEKILHLHGPSWNGWEGLDGVRLAREAVGLSLALEEHGSRLFKNGATVGGVLWTESDLSQQQRKDLREMWESAQAGLSNAYRTAILWNGLKWQPRAMQNDQAQWVEVRRFQVAEVCRFYRVLPIMVGESENTSTYASAEQMFLAHVTHTMGPWYKRIEQRLDLQLLTPDEREQGYYTRFNVSGLLRGAHRDRAEFYRVLWGLGAINANEIRAWEELNPYEEGDEYYVPMNMVEAGERPDADEGEPEPPEADPQAEATAEAEAESRRMVAEIKSMLGHLAARQPEASQVHVKAGDVHLTLPENMVQLHNAAPVIPAPAIEGKVPQGPAPVVNVTAPEVKVEVAAPDVTIEAVLPDELRITGMPARITESSVERDRDGNIVRTTQTERDA